MILFKDLLNAMCIFEDQYKRDFGSSEKLDSCVMEVVKNDDTFSLNCVVDNCSYTIYEYN